MVEKTKQLKKHDTYAGEIDINDFSTWQPNKARINKYAEADDLKNILDMKEKQKKEMNNYFSMTFDELRGIGAISNTDGRPVSTLTNEKWQKEFAIRKLFVTPSRNNKMQGKYSRGSEIWNAERDGNYDGYTNWQSYCRYINDILSNIKAGQVDYCYYIYQIMDLLKFHCNDLRTRYCDGYWEVWLDANKNRL